ncbi:AtpZ/AtpI family protein [Geobacter sulfurreducens]|uniref:ATP synthase-associated magnesium import membrane protein AtpZ n=1 Tax=Geobacter sulfurreducens (strain ATCC 51573 / DSM 12127 / PCA) TaxID=243231 RepID=Q74GB0_GEOSL|nr:AtpZ/AtpI family protein [Geobacter sulfurreducens]BET60163.1 AtpZ/AtpI family protein [Geobacter sp. 60473]AAR33669.1 ATP synthase-associated magnesium import membrane protein AtpZ [Geobacter sulfurreducens PCA]ADI83167.1 ATP synthase-associated magnesium import membrane protein AtpZ [Geobacter sulfurreducens KN400]AJY70061.1 membrane protein [Geobacter sulfurreducens]QVW35596.1 AtpZ/AtpI family protein [Geobacter sulfurreducens]
MNDDKRRLIQTLGLVSSMGISVALAIIIGVLIGRQLDKWLGTHPWFFFIFLFFGIAAGFRNIYIIAGRAIKKDDGDKDSRE